MCLVSISDFIILLSMIVIYLSNLQYLLIRAPNTLHYYLKIQVISRIYLQCNYIVKYKVLRVIIRFIC
jgi:hypothetical protein